MTGMFHSLYHQAIGSPAATAAPPERQFQAIALSWPASYLDGFVDADPEHWVVEVDGLIERPQSFNMKDFLGFTRIQQNRRLIFADGFSFRASWEGFVFSEILHRLGPKPEAQFLIQTNKAGRQECMPIRDLLNQRALFCLRVSGKPLPAVYGGPLRLLVFDRYAHKGLGQITRLSFVDQSIAGFYAAKGYEDSAEIQPGNYYAADLKSMQAVRGAGEVTQW